MPRVRLRDIVCSRFVSFHKRLPFQQSKKKAPEFPAPKENAREMRSSEFPAYQNFSSSKLLNYRIPQFLNRSMTQWSYLLSAIGLAPKSRLLFTAVRAARVAGIFAAAAP